MRIGQKHTKETRAKMSAAKLSSTYCNSGSLGYRHTKETRMKMMGNKNALGWRHSEEARAKMKAAQVGRPRRCHSEESRAKVSAALIGNTYALGHRHSKKVRAKISAALLGKCRSKETRAKISASLTGRCFSKETLVRMSKVSKQHWANKEFREKTLRANLKANCARPNNAEATLHALLNELFPGQWKYVGDGTLIIGGKCPDFVNINGQKKLIELFGDYWHRGEDPARRAAIFEPFGFQTLVVWEHELKDIEPLSRRLRKWA